MHRLILLAVLAGAPACGSWQRHVSLGSPRTDEPSAHSLAYFKLHPCERVGRGAGGARGNQTERLYSCGASPHPGPPLKVRTEIRLAGEISGFKIFEVDYYFDNDFQPPDTLGMKSILVQTGPRLFHEIYVTWPGTPGATVFPIEIVEAGRDAGRHRLLVSRFTDGGNSGGTFEAVFMILPDGAVLLDWGPVYHAAAEAVPEGKQRWLPSSWFDFPSLTWTVRTNEVGGSKVACCTGEVTVSFVIDKAGIVVAGKGRYQATDGGTK